MFGLADRPISSPNTGVTGRLRSVPASCITSKTARIAFSVGIAPSAGWDAMPVPPAPPGLDVRHPLGCFGPNLPGNSQEVF